LQGQSSSPHSLEIFVSQIGDQVTEMLVVCKVPTGMAVSVSNHAGYANPVVAMSSSSAQTTLSNGNPEPFGFGRRSPTPPLASFLDIPQSSAQKTTRMFGNEHLELSKSLRHPPRIWDMKRRTPPPKETSASKSEVPCRKHGVMDRIRSRIDSFLRIGSAYKYFRTPIQAFQLNSMSCTAGSRLLA
jgi:hypothetical protein